MDQRKIETLLAVLEKGSFSKAADVLCCTQSAVTQCMNSLEKELGCKVIERTYKGVRLTEAGERLYPFFTELNNNFERLMNEAENIAAGKDRPIRIGAFSSIANTWLPRLIVEYQELYPETSFDVQIGSESIAEWLLNEKIDIALGDELRCKVLNWTPLLEDHFTAIVSEKLFPEEKETISLEELEQHAYVMAPLDRTEEYIAIQPEKMIRVQCENDSVVISMVARGMGVSILPDSCLYDLPGTIRRLTLDQDYKRIIGIATGEHRSKPVLQFAAFIKKHVQEEL